MSRSNLTRKQWSTLLDRAGEPATFGDVVAEVKDVDMIDIDNPEQLVEDAITGDVLEENLDGGPFGAVRLAEHAEASNSACSNGEKTSSVDANPGGNTSETGGQTPVHRGDAVAALRDVLRFYNNRLDDTIADHTDHGQHPDRPTTAREYFTEVRGWTDDTVDDLLLGWAPADHVDDLVAYLHDRGHSREAMIATGALGEKDSGGLYATFSGRYVLPYYDADGQPAYAIARCTGGDGGGARDYGGHPEDWKAGKYAKLRHTDQRVPFEEPIYGLDTLEDDDHVVVAEGIADAITAREAGYAVLSPVAKEFKEAHYDPFADALENYDIERVTIVADADSIRNRDAEDAEPDSIREAVGSALSPVGAGLAGALRTATKLTERTDVDVRVTVPPAPADVENDLDEFVKGDWNGDLDSLLLSAKPADEYPELEAVASRTSKPAEAFEDFDPEEYEPTATEANETTNDIRDIFTAIDRLDAQRVADRTIVDEWLEGSTAKNRTFAPTWAPADYTGTAVYCDRDKFVDTGARGGKGGPAVMAAIDAGLVSDTQCPHAVRGETWFKAVDHLRELGFPVPKLETTADGKSDDYRPDPREITATVDVRRAWEAASRVEPGDVDADLPEAPDIVRAVALEEGIIDSADEPLSNDYPRAYSLAREEYDAPLPAYYTTADAIAEFEAVLDVLGEVTFWDLEVDTLESKVTLEGDDVEGQAVRALNPAWRESESEASVLVFESGNIWDADSGRTLDALRFVALDSGLIDDPAAPVEGELFTEGYRRLRDEYGAGLPRWHPAYTDDNRDITPQLPASEELLEERDLDGVDPDALEAAREEVEALLSESAESDETTVVTSLPATGKTTGTVKTARETPLAYLAARKELQQQALEKADRWGVSAEVLPVFCEERVRDDVLDAAVSSVREAGKTRLRDRWGILSTALEAINSDEDSDEISASEIFVEPDDEDDVDLERPTCPTAEGEHGPAWALAVHVARRLGYTPREIHTQARGLFGAELPCEGTCEYTEGWERATDPDTPADMLIGSYVHAHVPSVSRYIHRTDDGSVTTTDRAIVLDEFPGEAFTTEYGEEALDFATWLASNLREDVDDRRDMYTANLGSDTFVTAWLEGEVADTEVVGDAITTLSRFEQLFDACAAAESILQDVDDETLELFDLREPLQALDVEDAVGPLRDLEAAIVAANDHHPAAGLVDWVNTAVHEPLEKAVGSGDYPDVADLEELPIDADLAQLVEDTVDAVRERNDHAGEYLDAATTALHGGREGCRRLAAWADDGYAHPNAHHLLTAVIEPTCGEGECARVNTDSWAFDPDATEGTVVDVVETGSKARTVLDRNDHGAILHTPPAVDIPIVGLDATARESLWSVALQEEVTLADIHETPAERAQFLEDALDLRVIKAANQPRFYEGDPATKDTDGDVALLQAIANEYAGIEAPRERDGEVDTVGKPAAITTKGVRDLLEDDSRLEDIVTAWENYGNVKGANDLGGHRLAALLGCQHYGDDAIERFAALDGREVDTSRTAGRGDQLGYGDDLADDFLAHMTEDQTMQAILRFARGDSGATVVARTSALRDDLPVVGEAQVVGTWSKAATEVARAWRRVGDRFTVADVLEVADVDVTKRHVRRILAEFVEAGFLNRVEVGEGQATVFSEGGTPQAGEVELPDRADAVEADTTPGQPASNQYYTWNVRVARGSRPFLDGGPASAAADVRAPPTGPDQETDGSVSTASPPG